MHNLPDLSTRYMSVFNFSLVVWLWLGRIFVGTAGWMMILFPFSALPVLAIALITTTVMVRRRYPMTTWDAAPGEPGTETLSRPQTVAQLVAWIGLAGTGLFLVDAGAAEGSIFSAFFGHSRTMVHASFPLSIAFAIVFGLGWIALLGLLVARGPRKTAERRALMEAARTTNGHGTAQWTP